MIERVLPLPDPKLESVYLKRGVILIHIPKNAGTSVEDALYGYRVRHRTWAEVQTSCPRAWITLPKIAIVRDPLERFLSAYDYLRGGGRNAADRAFAKWMIGTQSVTEVAERLSKSPGYRRVATQYFHFRPQSDYVCDGGVLMVDRLIPFPHMADGLLRYANVSPNALQHANRTLSQRTNRRALTPTTVDQIEAIYSDDRVLYEDTMQSWANANPTGPKGPCAGATPY